MGLARRRRPAIGIPVRGLVTLASRPHRAVSAAMVMLLLTDQADRAGDPVRGGLVEPVGGEHRGEPLMSGNRHPGLSQLRSCPGS